MRIMKLVAFLLFACLWATAMAPAGVQDNSASDLAAEIKRGKELHDRALGIVQAEQARAKQALCPKAQSTLDINECYSAEVTTTDANYTKLVRALGALLRAGDGSSAAPARIPFDDAEAAWHTYREMACKAAGDQYEGGTIRPSIEMSCSLTLTRHHIDELWVLYSDLGTR
jgi:uncharacterized protein YecT (DUF1311 family)